MIENTLRKISLEIEFLAKNNISLVRALDMIEASTTSLEEIVIINTFRESIADAGDFVNSNEKTHDYFPYLSYDHKVPYMEFYQA